MTMGNFVVDLRFDTFDQFRCFDESRTTANHNREPSLFLKSFMFSKLCTSLPLTLLWHHRYYTLRFRQHSTSREKSKRENESQKGQTIFISGNEIKIFSLLHFTNILTICFSGHRMDDETWLWFHWISLEYSFILSWKKYIVLNFLEYYFVLSSKEI